VNGVVYAAGTDGTIHAVDAATGQARWTAKTGVQLDAAPVVTADRLYVGGRDAVVYAYDLSGNRVWRFWTDGEIRSSPVVTADAVYVANQKGNLYGVTLGGGEKWHVSVGSVAAAPTLAGDLICATADAAALQCVRADNGQAAPRITPPNGLSGTPVGTAGLVFGAGTDGIVTAWNTATGTQLWRFAPASGASGAGYPARANDVVYLTGPGGDLAALDAASGTAQWEFSVPDTLVAPAVVDSGLLYAVGQTGTVYALVLPASGVPPVGVTSAAVPPSGAPTTTRAAQQEPPANNNPPRRTRNPATKGTSEKTTSATKSVAPTKTGGVVPTGGAPTP
jgi:outer membrane protein assembly factor BamB